MRKLIAIFSLLCFSSFGQTVNVTWNFTDYTGNPQAVSQFTLKPSVKAVAQNGTNVLIPFPVSAVTGLTGSVTMSNVVTGYFYIGSLLDVTGKPVATMTNFFPTNISGNVNASAYLTNFVPATVGFSALLPGDNVTFTTNNGALTINSTGGSGGGITNGSTNVTLSGAFSGNASGLTNLAATNLTGIITASTNVVIHGDALASNVTAQSSVQVLTGSFIGDAGSLTNANPMTIFSNNTHSGATIPTTVLPGALSQLSISNGVGLTNVGVNSSNQLWVSINGNDSNAGNQLSPLLTINKALTTASNLHGAVINVGPGRFGVSDGFLTTNVVMVGTPLWQSVLTNIASSFGILVIAGDGAGIYGMQVGDGTSDTNGGVTPLIIYKGTNSQCIGNYFFGHEDCVFQKRPLNNGTYPAANPPASFTISQNKFLTAWDALVIPNSGVVTVTYNNWFTYFDAQLTNLNTSMHFIYDQGTAALICGGNNFNATNNNTDATGGCIVTTSGSCVLTVWGNTFNNTNLDSAGGGVVYSIQNSGTLISLDGVLPVDIAQNGTLVNRAYFTGNGSGLTNLNASSLASGTVPLIVLPTNNATVSSNIYNGNGAGLTNIPLTAFNYSAFARATNAVVTNTFIQTNSDGTSSTFSEDGFGNEFLNMTSSDGELHFGIGSGSVYPFAINRTNGNAGFLGTVSATGFSGSGSGLTNLNMQGLLPQQGGMFNGSLPATSTKFAPSVGLNAGLLNNETNCSQFFSGPCAISNLYCVATLAAGTAIQAGTNITVTLMTNKVSTGITVTFTNGVTMQSDLTHSVLCTNAWVDMKIDTVLGGATSGFCLNWSFNR